jgi:hypothetical protein
VGSLQQQLQLRYCHHLQFHCHLLLLLLLV